MSCLNTSTRSHPAAFLLVSIPGLQEAQFWIAFPFCIMYVIAVLGNATVLCFIKTEPSLQEPMYLFLAMLAITDLVLSTSTLPNMLSICWLGSREIGFHACLTQMFFVHAFSSVESGVLMALALDRYVAIRCLRHSSTLSVPAIVTMGSLVLARGVLLVSPFSLLVRRLPFCQRCRISHSHSNHMAVVKLVCGDATVSIIYGLFVAFMVLRFDVLVISVSYATILQAVLRLLCSDAHLKSFSTCASLLCVILTYYVPALFIFLTHRFGLNVPHHVHILVANLCGCPPM
ncbi:olfactory receptor 52R1-like [Malaclemys terrapin pileata]|uniref:olfactory receptor 52R1-like n=1 Tax=Malaclemys terrapin pileata TaxID=2991368 RepID=UPI0023A82753|nr:olfactory receptor 52R1-like [Malaclemys terrapin pileata]